MVFYISRDLLCLKIILSPWRPNINSNSDITNFDLEENKSTESESDSNNNSII